MHVSCNGFSVKRTFARQCACVQVYDGRCHPFTQPLPQNIGVALYQLLPSDRLDDACHGTDARINNAHDNRVLRSFSPCPSCIAPIDYCNRQGRGGLLPCNREKGEKGWSRSGSGSQIATLRSCRLSFGGSFRHEIKTKVAALLTCLNVHGFRSVDVTSTPHDGRRMTIG